MRLHNFERVIYLALVHFGGWCFILQVVNSWGRRLSARCRVNLESGVSSPRRYQLISS